MQPNLAQSRLMCLILFAIDSHPDYPLVLAANREERHARATVPMAPWPEAGTDNPGILAGRDLEAGGTWIGLHRDGRFAAITNRREGIPTTGGLRSRGDLTRAFLEGGAAAGGANQSAENYARRVFDEARHYAGFNLLVGDRDGLWYCATAIAPIRLEPGVYGLSNGQLDTPWPKVVNGKVALRRQLAAPSIAGLLSILQDRAPATDGELPDTGIDIDLERTLSSCFIVGEEYGTRASTALLIDREGIATVAEQNFGPLGSVRELQQWRWPLAAIPC
jgi:uncharacterized protein with NRDE domain